MNIPPAAHVCIDLAKQCYEGPCSTFPHSRVSPTPTTCVPVQCVSTPTSHVARDLSSTCVEGVRLKLKCIRNFEGRTCTCISCG